MTRRSHKSVSTFVLSAFIFGLAQLGTACSAPTTENWHVIVGMGMTTDDIVRLSPRLGGFLEELDQTASALPLGFVEAGYEAIGTLRIRGDKSVEELVLRNVITSVTFYEQRVKNIRILRFDPPEKEPTFRELLGAFSRAGFTGKNGESVEAT